MKVDVCGKLFDLKEIESNTRADTYMGRCDPKMATITINKDMPPEMKESSLIHEWLHGVLTCVGMQEYSDNEILISFLENELYRAGFRVKREK